MPVLIWIEFENIGTIKARIKGEKIDEKNLVPGMDESTSSDLESLSEHIGKLHLFIYIVELSFDLELRNEFKLLPLKYF